ncbi:serine hydrolase domain-containing protein [Natronorarus salvus]|uniref:serine hydrolase domain-containing protein n=1 Tax=Natronorarus salvus TaxID=3117733 RepID=UPI002F26AB58
MAPTELSRRGFLSGAMGTGATAFAGGLPVAAEAGSEAVSEGLEGLEGFVDDLMAEGLAEHDVAGATVSVVHDGSVEFAKGYGYADVEAGREVRADETLFRIGSVSKLFGWTAAMQGAERDAFDLDTDVNRYLEEVTIPGTYTEPITLSHLATHTPGFEERLRGTFVANEDDLRPLAEVLREEQPARVRPPGELASYSNYGSALVGQVVAEWAGTSFEAYVEAEILAPLGMERTTFGQPVPEDLEPDLSRGYRYTGGGFREGEFEYVGIPPAGSASATATDMARFMLANLNGGEVEGGRVLEPESVERMHERRFGHDDRINGVAFGFYERSRGDLRVIAHGGDTELFHTELLLIPDLDLGLFVSYNSPGGVAAREEFVGRFLDRFDPAAGSEPPLEPDGAPAHAEAIEGSYRGLRIAETTYEKLVGATSTAEVAVDADGTVVVSTLGEEWRFVEIDDLLFREVGAEETLVFREEDGEITHAFLGSVPVMAFERLDWYERPLFQGAVAGLTLLVLLSAVVGWPLAMVRRRYRDGPPPPERPRIARWLAGTGAVFLFGFLVGVVVLLATDPVGTLLSPPTTLQLLLVLPVLAALTTLWATLYVVRSWRASYWGVLSRLHYTLVVASAVGFCWLLSYWNLLGAWL